jgi:hypothetical protein
MSEQYPHWIVVQYHTGRVLSVFQRKFQDDELEEGILQAMDTSEWKNNRGLQEELGDVLQSLDIGKADGGGFCIDGISDVALVTNNLLHGINAVRDYLDQHEMLSFCTIIGRYGSQKGWLTYYSLSDESDLEWPLAPEGILGSV